MNVFRQLESETFEFPKIISHVPDELTGETFRAFWRGLLAVIEEQLQTRDKQLHLPAMRLTELTKRGFDTYEPTDRQIAAMDICLCYLDGRQLVYSDNGIIIPFRTNTLIRSEREIFFWCSMSEDVLSDLRDYIIDYPMIEL